MFLLGNLLEHGAEGRGHRRATAFFVDRLDEPRAVLGVTEWGVALAYGEGAEAMAEQLRGRTLRGISGEAALVREVMRAGGRDRAATVRDGDEPHFALDLAALRVPDGPGRLGPIDPATARAWRLAYERELNFGKGDPEDVSALVDDWLRNDSCRMLSEQGAPVALTGFDARLPEIVQVGGVYVPPALRGRGHARRAVALHLEEVRAQGVRRATLFAASEDAASAYRAIGFHQIGSYALVLFAPEGEA